MMITWKDVVSNSRSAALDAVKEKLAAGQQQEALNGLLCIVSSLVHAEANEAMQEVMTLCSNLYMVLLDPANTDCDGWLHDISWLRAQLRDYSLVSRSVEQYLKQNLDEAKTFGLKQAQLVTGKNQVVQSLSWNDIMLLDVTPEGKTRAYAF